MDREAAARAIDAFLRALGHDPVTDPDLTGTGARVAAAWADELLAGYDVDVPKLLSDGVIAGRSGLVVVRDVPVVTMCPHHLIPSSGLATVAFAPADRLVGVGTVARVVDAYARRLALQERVGEEVVDAIHERLAPHWVACRLVLVHGCMTARGERAHGSRVETVAVRGGPVDLVLVHGTLGVGR